MIVGNRLRAIREAKHLSQGDIEKRTGLLRCYISRVEHGHTVPTVETLEKFAGASGVQLYELFYDGENPPAPRVLKSKGDAHHNWGAAGKDARVLHRFRKLLEKIKKPDRKLLLHTSVPCIVVARPAP